MAGSFSAITLLDMCFFRIIALAFLLYGCTGARYPSYRECREGETWTEGCSTCFCMSAGWQLCMGRCPDQQQTEPPPPAPVINTLDYRHNQPKNSRLRGPCVPGDTFGEGCSKCTCTPSGLWACTGFCPPAKRLDKQQTGVFRAIPDACIVGAMKEQGCAKCFCIAPGRWVCTGLCPQKTMAERREFPVDPDGCTIGETIDERCYKCYCIMSGQWACNLLCPVEEMGLSRKNRFRLKRKNASRQSITVETPLIHENPSHFHVPLPRGVSLSRNDESDSETDNYDDYHSSDSEISDSDNASPSEYDSDDEDSSDYSDSTDQNDEYDSENDDGISVAQVGTCLVKDITANGCAICICVDGQWRCTGDCPVQTYFDNDDECNTGDTRKDTCTVCRCSDRRWVCSSFCPLWLERALIDNFKTYQKSRAISRSHMFLIDKAAKCAPGDISEEACSKCYCIAPGRWVCMETCPHLKPDEADGSEEGSETHILVTDDASECEVGKAFTATCGRCFCIAPGWLVCTGLCHHVESDALQLMKRAKQMEAFAHPDERKENPTCRVGEIIHLDCYECLCTTAGMMSCIQKGCLRARPKQQYNTYQATPVPSEIEVHYKKLGYGPEYCPIGKVIHTTDCTTCTCVLKGVMVCTKNYCEKSIQTLKAPSHKAKLSVKPLFSGPVLEYEAEYYDLDY